MILFVSGILLMVAVMCLITYLILELDIFLLYSFILGFSSIMLGFGLLANVVTIKNIVTNYNPIEITRDTTTTYVRYYDKDHNQKNLSSELVSIYKAESNLVVRETINCNSYNVEISRNINIVIP